MYRMGILIKFKKVQYIVYFKQRSDEIYRESKSFVLNNIKMDFRKYDGVIILLF